MAELQRLSILIGGLPDRAIACAFVAELPEEARRMLRSSSRMDDLTTIQILARARALMIEERNNGTDEKFAVAAMKSIDSRLLEDQTKSVCYECKLPNHFARDCHLRRNDNRNKSGRRRETSDVLCYTCQEYEHMSRICPKNGEGEDVCASSLPKQSVMALPTILLDINGVFQDVLIDSGCRGEGGSFEQFLNFFL